jgi:hypothetical protein
MAQQKVFKEAYVDVLRDSVEPEKYAGECFEYDESQVKPLANVHQPVDLLDKMDPDNLLESAIALFEAYKDLTPLAASKIELWAYLSHVDLFGFMQKWYPEVTEGKADARFIRDRWFRSPKGPIRSSLAGLWWSVYCSIDESREDKYELTRMLFRNDNIRTHYFGPSTIFRHREAVIGILEFLVENPDISNVHFSSRCIYIIQYFNRLGAVKQLAYLDREFFKEELMKKKEILRTVTSKAQVLGGQRISE